MHQSVLDSFVKFSAPLEGICKNLYLDVKGLATTAIGCLVDPVQLAIALPWKRPDGTPASADEIATQWRALKAQPRMKDYPALSKTVLGATTMRLTDDGILEVVARRLLANERVLRSYFPGWDVFPADAQLACCSIAWACGAGFPQTFSNFRAAANAQDWAAAAVSCGIRTTGNPGIVPRNAANRLCLANAQAVVSQGLPLDALHWPDTTPDASQRDQALRAEATLALAGIVSNVMQHGGEYSTDESETDRA